MAQDRVPAAAAVARLVRAVLGEDLDIRPIEEGGEHAAWWAGSRYVVRFALDAAGSARQRREIALRDLIRPYIEVPVPDSVATGEWAAGLTFTVDTRLPGRSAEEQAVGEAGEADLARLLAGLRSIPPEKAAAIGVPPDTSPPVDDLAERATAAAHALVALGELPAPPAIPAHHAAAPMNRVLLHNDLKGEHLRVTGEGRIRGVLDWTDAAIGDPAPDIAGLAIAVGSAAAVRIGGLAGYDRAVVMRGVALARHRAVLLLAGRLHGTDDSPLDLLRAQLARAAQPTPLRL